jgi:hypothetical protein
MENYTMKREQADTASNSGAPTDTIEFHAAVIEGRTILTEIEKAERGQLRLGELADTLAPKYGDRTVAKFADELGIAKCTLDRYRTVYRAWAGKLAPGPNLPVSFAALRELATHPDREQIIQKNPNITNAEARDRMRQLNGKSKKEKEAEQEDGWLKENKKWFKDLVVLANDATRAAGVPNQCTPEQLEKLTPFAVVCAKRRQNAVQPRQSTRGIVG